MIARTARLLDAAMSDAAPFADTFKAWRTGAHSTAAEPIDIVGAENLLAALNYAKMGSLKHKDTLAILHCSTRLGKQVLHLYAVKTSTKVGFYRDAYDGGPKVWQRGLDCAPISSFEVLAFCPVEPFRWSPGCDAVGAPKFATVQA